MKRSGASAGIRTRVSRVTVSNATPDTVKHLQYWPDYTTEAGSVGANSFFY
jgi:hypothetical protein